MPKEPRCSICSDPAKLVAVNQLAEAGRSIRDISAATKCARSSIGRHLLHSATRKPGALRKGGNGARSSQAGRLSGGRCPTCGVATDDADPKALIRRAERALYFGEAIVGRAVEESDDRLALQGLDRVRTSLEQLMKVNGLLQPDGATTVIVSAEEMSVRKALSIVVNAVKGERRQVEMLSAMRPFLDDEATVTIEAQAVPALGA